MVAPLSRGRCYQAHATPGVVKTLAFFCAYRWWWFARKIFICKKIKKPTGRYPRQLAKRWVGGGQFLSERGSCRPAPLPLRDFFIVSKIFGWADNSERVKNPMRRKVIV
jgi:hypothetical protein